MGAVSLSLALGRLNAAAYLVDPDAPTGFRLKGELKEVGAFHVVMKIRELRLTGVLSLKNAAKTKQKRIYVQDGEPIGFRSNLKRDLIGRHLIRMRAIAEEQLEAAVRQHERLAESRLKLGEFLIRNGHVEASTIHRALEIQRELHLLQIIAWNDGEYEFEPRGSIVGWERSGVPVDEWIEAIEALLDRDIDVELLQTKTQEVALLKAAELPPLAGGIEEHPIPGIFMAIRKGVANGRLTVDRQSRVVTVSFENGFPKLIQVMGTSRSLLLNGNDPAQRREFMAMLVTVLAFTSGEFRVEIRPMRAIETPPAPPAFEEPLPSSVTETRRMQLSPTFIQRIEELQRSNSKTLAPSNLVFVSEGGGVQAKADVQSLDAHFSKKLQSQ